ncbi:hypothetical protein ACROYT_G038010 [Oculina patagonica]
MSASVKRTVPSQAVLRVLLNCSPLLPWANVVEKVEEKRGDGSLNAVFGIQQGYQGYQGYQGLQCKVVKKTGTTLKEVLQKSDPFKLQRCGREDCLVCKQAGKGPCNAHGVTYEIECQGCKDKYVGETARNAYTRGIELTEGLENQDEKSALWKHCVEKHEKERQEFKMSVTGMYGNDAILRQIAESVRINRVAKGSLINTKKEWNYVKLPRVALDEGEI